jgi:hypothetical protein
MSGKACRRFGWTDSDQPHRGPDVREPLDGRYTPDSLPVLSGLARGFARDIEAPDVSGVLRLDTARTDNPLEGLVAPRSAKAPPGTTQPSHLEEVLGDLISRQRPAGRSNPSYARTPTTSNTHTQFHAGWS